MRHFKCLSVPKTWRFIALFSLLSFFSQGASAVDYFWTYTFGGTRYPTAESACKAKLGSTYHHIAFPNGPGSSPAFCYWKRASDGAVMQSGGADRDGDSCPPDKPYDSQIGGCAVPPPDPCKDTIGFKDHQHQIGNLDGSGSRIEPPSSICESSCQYAFTYEAPTDCYRFGDGTNKNGAFCKYKYKGNGTSCTNGPTTPPGSLFDQPPTKPPIKLDPTLTKDIQCSDWVTNPDGTGSRSCTNVSEYKDPGKINCPPGSSGTVVCSPSSPPPDYKKEDVTTTEGKKNNPDGSSQSDTTKTTTTTVCKGTQPCVTTTKTEGDSTGTNPDGTPGDTSSTCTGSGCKPSTEEKPEEEEDEESTVSGDGACPAPPSCTGDAIQCAILRQTHQQRCADEEFRKLDEPKFKTDITAAFSGSEFQPITPGSEGTFDLGGMIDTSSRFNKTCPVVPDISFPWLDGKTVTISPAQIFTDFCQYLFWFGYFVVAFAMRRAAEIIAMGMN